MMEVVYKMPAYGLGTDFAESERPLTFAEAYENRFRNVTGAAERRPGLARFSNPIATAPNLTRLHEWISNTGQDVLAASDDEGNIWRYNISAGTSAAWTAALTGKSASRILSVEANGKLIFCNGIDRNFYSDDGCVTFKELKALISTGSLATGSNTTTVEDGNITNWIAETNVSDSSIVHNITQNGYGIVTVIVSSVTVSAANAALTITTIGSSGVANGAGVTTTGQNQVPGDSYEIIDYVNLNIIPNGTPNKTNVGNAGTGTTTTVVAVSGVNFAKTEIRTGDFVYNTTQGAIAMIGSVSANVNLQQTINSQVANDSLTFFKSAMPISIFIHVHYGRVYYLDSRNQTRVVISASDDPQDVTTYQQTLDSTSFSFDTQQPAGDTLLAMASFQQYFVAAGVKNLYIYQGITPIQEQNPTTVGNTVAFSPIAFYPNGVASRFGLGTNGTDLLHVTVDGLQAINIATVAFTTLQNNISVPIRTVVTNLINEANPDDVQLTFYPRRSWLVMKIGDSCYVLNTFPSYDESGTQRTIPSWHLFSGAWAQQNHYFVRRNGDLLSCGPNGLIYNVDSSASTDDGVAISTELTTAWLRLEEPQRTPRIKTGQYIRPEFESGAPIGYTISVVAGWDNFSSDSIIASAGSTGAIGSAVIGVDAIGEGQFVQANKYPLRWRGEQARITFTTQSSAAPDVITGFYLYGDIGGVR